MPRQLTITPAPFKSSYLAIPPTPFSPRLPISPLAFPETKHHNGAAERRKAQLKSTVDLLPPPSNPLNWLWQCHKCNRVYQLGVTRRCLDDGHFFCAGTTTVTKKTRGKSGKVVRRHAACASEFDYQGWKGWGVWRRSVGEQIEAAEALLRAEEAFESAFMERDAKSSASKWSAGHSRHSSAQRYWDKSQAPTKKDCWEKCDYPSECRWGKQFGVKTPTAPTVPSTTTTRSSSLSSAIEEESSSSSDGDVDPATSFEEILRGLSESAMGTSSTQPPPSTGDITDLPIVPEEASTPAPDYLEPLSPRRHARQKSITEGETPIVSMDDLLESVKRRKRRSSSQIPSPLGANPPSPVALTFDQVHDGAELVRSASAVDQDAHMSAGPKRRSWDDLDLGVVEVPKGLSLQEKAGGFVRGLVVQKKKHNSNGKQRKRSDSDGSGGTI